MGIVHKDTKGRASFALDLLEPLRPQIEGLVLDLLAQRTFRKADFAEGPDGHLRLRPPLTHELAEAMPAWAQAVAPWAEYVAHTFGRAMAGKYEASTPLTGRRTRDAQAVVKARRASASTAARSSVSLQRPTQGGSPASWNCPDCGGAVSNHRHVRCDACIAADPRQAPEIRGRRGAAIAARKRALIEWDQANPGTVHNPELFRRDILPRLSTAKLSEIVEATGMSKAFASQVRAGKFAPHVSTWRALAELAGVKLAAGPADK
jgi:hypothetical protein